MRVKGRMRVDKPPWTCVMEVRQRSLLERLCRVLVAGNRPPRIAGNRLAHPTPARAGSASGRAARPAVALPGLPTSTHYNLLQIKAFTANDEARSPQSVLRSEVEPDARYQPSMDHGPFRRLPDGRVGPLGRHHPARRQANVLAPQNASFRAWMSRKTRPQLTAASRHSRRVELEPAAAELELDAGFLRRSWRRRQENDRERESIVHGHPPSRKCENGDETGSVSARDRQAAVGVS